MQMRLYKAFEDFSKDVLVACNHEEMAADIALTVILTIRIIFIGMEEMKCAAFKTTPNLLVNF